MNPPAGRSSADATDHICCSVCGYPAINSTCVTIDTGYFDDFGWCYDPTLTYAINICHECQATNEDPSRLIPQAYEEWRKWYISALSDSIDCPVAP